VILPFLLSPIGRYVALGAIAVVVCTGLFWKIRSDAVALAEARRIEIELERLQNAIRAGDSVDVSPDGLRKPDRFIRN
jgi:hypothetical protein